MYSINRIKSMEVIDVSNGRKIGFVADLKIDIFNYRILSIIIPIQGSGWFNKQDVLEIPWEQIFKVGEDVLLVNGYKEGLVNSI
ncbi:YlmC/YmxH family sporulation protein [Clostridium grantii]|uniref:Sporulation protein, YlmC/YmxH family n=1 Tax=Clostridium grantii DSM 8605 TaxID=1121316 RepID=A0A1M5QTE2_9CLOT|nr:YlmC/YmxH family sporulation protein [Clostridium grantii]SHH16873.1 sporulation protein, YlmC/YmxH family [Clostridium grantii DSM 8605]